MVICQKLLTYTQLTENVKYLRVHIPEIFGKMKISESLEKITEIRAIYFDTQGSRSAVYSVGSSYNIVSHVMSSNPISIRKVFR